MRLIYRFKQIILIGCDLTAYFVGLYLALFVRYLEAPAWHLVIKNLGLFTFVFFLWLIINYITGLYDLPRVQNNLRFYRRLLETAAISLIIGIVFFYLLPNRNITPKTILLLNVAIGYSLSAIFRLLYNILIGQNKLTIRTLFIGYTKEVEELIKILKDQPGKNYEPVAIIEIENDFKVNGVEVYRSLKTIRPVITNHEINMVVVAPHLKQDTEAQRELYELLFWQVQMVDLTGFYELITGRIPPSTFSESWFLDHLKNKQKFYEKIISLLDITAGIFLSAIFIITALPISLAVKLSSKGPIFYKQQRLGRFGKIFNIYKFRSMYALSDDGSAETAGWQFAGKKDKRITSVGRILRKTRLDEIPQAFNLLKGDISLIGPRPERPQIAKQLTEKMPYYHLRHMVKPGLTGWAVLHQNYTDTLESSLQKLQYDLYYIKNRSLLLDISIILRTLNLLARMKGQ